MHDLHATPIIVCLRAWIDRGVLLEDVTRRPGPNERREGVLKDRPGRERYFSGAADFFCPAATRALGLALERPRELPRHASSVLGDETRQSWPNERHDGLFTGGSGREHVLLSPWLTLGSSVRLD